MKNIQSKLYELLETSTGDRPSRIIDTFLVALIIANIVAVTLHTVHSLAVKYNAYFRSFEAFSILVFSVEYIIRMWICVKNETYRRPVVGRIKYFFSPFALIDLIAVAPFYLPMLIPVDLIFMRALRLLRLFRLLKLGRYSDSIRTMGAVLKAKKEPIAISATMSAILLLVASSLMYFIENVVQPGAFSSIPATMWWAVETMTTVGYGDIYPETPAGKVLAGIIAVLGISLFILPAGIIATGYAEEIQKKKDDEDTHAVCPKCGHPIR
jgi:voltage-gated potassium channel